jgi:hypothetical protein
MRAAGSVECLELADAVEKVGETLTTRNNGIACMASSARGRTSPTRSALGNAGQDGRITPLPVVWVSNRR